jgi:hypothetical protein
MPNTSRCQPDVDRPERDRERPFVPGKTGSKGTQAEQHQAETEHAVDAEERGVPVHGSEIQPCA